MPNESRDREKQIETGLKLLREVVLKEAENLRLVENRAYVYRSSATTLSKKNHEESTQLLERAIGQIDAEMAELQTPLVQYRIADLRRLRDQMVLVLSELDPIRALRSVRASKGEPQPDDSRPPVDPALESLVLQKAAATNPALVLDRATKSLSGTLFPDVVDTYEALRERNPEMGRQLACAIVARLRDETPDPASPAGQAALALMADIASGQHGTVLDSALLDGSSMRQLVAFVADLLLVHENPMSTGYGGDLTRFAGILENYAPSKGAQLRRCLAKLSFPQLAFGPLDMKELETSLHTKNYDDAARWAKKAPVEARQYALSRIVEVQIDNGQLDLAQSFVSSQITDPGIRDELLGRLASAAVESATQKGDETTTSGVAPLLRSGDDRISTLLSLARTEAQNGDRVKASALLEEALALPSDKSEQLKNEMVVAQECLKFDTARCLEIVSAHIERLNAMLGASAVLDGYFGPECIQEGEMRYLSPSPLFPVVVTLSDVLGEIAMIDSDQALRLARHIAGPELQMLAILTIARHLVLGPDYRPNSDEPTFVQARPARFERK